MYQTNNINVYVYIATIIILMLMRYAYTLMCEYVKVQLRKKNVLNSRNFKN